MSTQSYDTRIVTQVIGLSHRGMDKKDIAKEVGISTREVNDIMEEARKSHVQGTAPKLSHEQRKERADAIGEFMKAGIKEKKDYHDLVRQAIKKWGVSVTTVTNAAARVGVRSPVKRRNITLKQTLKLISLMITGKTMSEAADLCEMSRQSAEIIRDDLVNSGLAKAILKSDRETLELHIRRVTSGGN